MSATSTGSVARRATLIGPSHEDLLLDQPLEPCLQDVARDTQPALKVIEPRRPDEAFAQHEQCPAFTDDLEDPGDRAVLSLVGAPQHADDPSRAARTNGRSRIGFTR
jgi:hypothetical protein